MRAIKIDPATREITEVEGNFADNLQIYRALRITTLTTILFRGDGVIAFIDDNGHLKAGNPCFTFKPYADDYPLAGAMLLCGLSGPATTGLPAHITVEAVAAGVVWRDDESTGQFTGAGPTDTGYDMGRPVTRPRSA